MAVVLRWSGVLLLCRRRRVAAAWCSGVSGRMQCDGLAQDGGVVWRRGGIDGRPGMVNAMISLEDGVEEDGGSNFCGVCVGVR